MMREKLFLNQGTVTVEVHTKLIMFSKQNDRKKAIRNYPSIHTTLIISLINVTVRNQIPDSDVNRRIILLQIFRNRKLRMINFTGRWKCLKLARTD